jgi:hypothetical protein
MRLLHRRAPAAAGKGSAREGDLRPSRNPPPPSSPFASLCARPASRSHRRT